MNHWRNYLVRAGFLGLVTAGAFWPRLGWGHGDVHGQIVEVTKLIEKDPKNAQLYLRRGELHRAHQDWDSAHSDYDLVATHDPSLKIVDLARGKTLLDAGWPLSAKTALDRFLAVHTNHVDGLTARARAFGKLGLRLDAARDYTSAIANSPEAMPELFVERAQALAAEGGPYLEKALEGLDEGIRRLGPLVTLQLHAIDLDVKLGRVPSALDRLERVAAQSPRKETWLARRGEILRQAGREKEAMAAFQLALQAIERLPAARRNVPAMVELRKRLELALEGPPKSPLTKDAPAKGTRK